MKKFSFLFIVLTMLFCSAVTFAAKPILIEGAMEIETDYLKNLLTDKKIQKIGQWTYARGKINGVDVVICKTEIGMTNSAAATVLAVEKFHPRAIIFTGVAGSHDKNLNRGDLVIGVKTVNISAWKTNYLPEGVNFDDEGIPTDFYIFNSDEKIVYLDADEKLLSAARSVKNKYSAGKIVEGIHGSCDNWNQQVEKLKFWNKNLKTSSEDMETHSVAQIAKLYKIPFISFRAISNSHYDGTEGWSPEFGIDAQKFVVEVLTKIGENSSTSKMAG